MFYYDVDNGFDFNYYNSSQDYTPVFDIEANASPEEQEEARQVCTIDGTLNDACVYDYHATGNAESSTSGARVYSNYTTAQETLGLF